MADFEVLDGDDCFISFCEKFKYLGPAFAKSLSGTSESSVKKGKQFFSRKNYRSRGVVSRHRDILNLLLLKGETESEP
jgi:hypothetical protein